MLAVLSVSVTIAVCSVALLIWLDYVGGRCPQLATVLADLLQIRYNDACGGLNIKGLSKTLIVKMACRLYSRGDHMVSERWELAQFELNMLNYKPEALMERMVVELFADSLGREVCERFIAIDETDRQALFDKLRDVVSKGGASGNGEIPTGMAQPSVSKETANGVEA